MEHADMRRKLSAYLDNAVTDEEKVEIKRHLGSCGTCRGAIADLELMVGYLKTLPEIEPPPWLTTKIMAEIREISAPKGPLWRRLFFPLHIKLPIEAVALVFLCVTGLYLARTISTQAPLITPSHAPQHSAAPPSAAAPTAPIPQGKIRSVQPGKPMPPPTVSAPAAQQPELEPEPAPARTRGEMSEPELRPADEGTMMEREAPLPAKEEKSVPSETLKRAKKTPAREELPLFGGVPAEKGEITLTVDDPAAAGGAIEEAVIRLGGTINGHSYSEESHLLIIRIGAQKVTTLLDRLERIGAVQEKPHIPKGAGGTVDLTIRW
jgi:Predicted integral membrane protein (DUF2275)/Putative zinc-finger